MATSEKTDTTPAEVARSYFEAVGNRDIEGMLSHWHPDGVGHIHGLIEAQVPETYRGWFADMFKAFPDFKFEVLDLVADEERAGVRWKAPGPFNGPIPLEGMYPTGATIPTQGCDVLTIR